MLEFITMTDPAVTPQLFEMMRGLYAAEHTDPQNAPGEMHFRRTVDRLLTEPHRGRILLFIDDTAIYGYAILIPYWSNEFGGNLLFVDELFVKPEFRNRGIARKFFDFLRTQRPFDAVVCALEVSPNNSRARKLYKSLGFEPRKYTMMTRRFP